MDKVRQEGDAAVKEYTAKFDKVQLMDVCIKLEVCIPALWERQAHGNDPGSLTCMQDVPEPVLPRDVTAAFDVAFSNIKAFHEAQQYESVSVETMPGVTCRRVARPIGKSSLVITHVEGVACSVAFDAACCMGVQSGLDSSNPAPLGKVAPGTQPPATQFHGVVMRLDLSCCFTTRRAQHVCGMLDTMILLSRTRVQQRDRAKHRHATAAPLSHSSSVTPASSH